MNVNGTEGRARSARGLRSALLAVTLSGLGLLAGCGAPDASRSAGQAPSGDEAAVEAALHGYFDAFKAQDTAAFAAYVTSDFLLYEGGYPVPRGRFVETWDPGEPITEVHRFRDLEIEVYGDVAALSYILQWSRDGEVRLRGRETALARRVEGGWKFERFHSSWFPPIEPTSVAELEEYVGSYGGSAPEADAAMELRVVREGERLYASRADGQPWIAGLARVELFPAGEDRFYLEVTTDPVHVRRDGEGRVAAMTIRSAASEDSLRLDRQ